MDIGAILTPREVEVIRSRLRKLSAATTDRKIREQVRMVFCTINKAERRITRKKDNNPKLF